MKIVCPISVGEFVDKISILLVKKGRIKDLNKLAEFEKELAALAPQVPFELNKEIDALVRLNQQLFDALELQDQLIKNGEYLSQKFSETAYTVYNLNKARYELKKALNIKYQSDITEQKSY